MSVLDILIICVLAFSVITGYKKGLILTLVSMGSYIVAAILTKANYIAFSNWILFNTPIGEGIKSVIEKNLSFTGERTIQEGVFASESSFKLFNWANEYLAKEVVQDYAVQTIEAIRNEVIMKIALLLTNLIAIVVLFLIIRGLIILGGYILNNIFELPVLNSINKMAGLAIGGLRGVLIVSLLLIILLPSAMAAPEGKLSTIINSSVLIQVFFNSILIHILNWFL